MSKTFIITRFYQVFFCHDQPATIKFIISMCPFSSSCTFGLPLDIQNDINRHSISEGTKY